MSRRIFALAYGVLAYVGFVVELSVMARPSVKRWLTRLGPLLWQWRPLIGTVWSAESSGVRILLWTLYGRGLGVPASQHIPHWTLRLPVDARTGPRGTVASERAH